MKGMGLRCLVGVAGAFAVAAPAAAGCLATSALELNRGPYTALAAPPDASQWSMFLHDGRADGNGSQPSALLAAVAAGCSADPAAGRAALEQLDRRLDAADPADRAVLALHRLELGFGRAVRGGVDTSQSLAHSAEALASDAAVPPGVRAAAAGIAAQVRALSALARGDDAAFAQAMRDAEAAGAALADAAPAENLGRVDDSPIRGRYLQYGHASRMLHLWTDHAQTGRLLAADYVVDILAQEARWSVEDMRAAYDAMDAANRSRLARDAALSRFWAAQRRLEDSVRFEHAPYLWAANRLQVANRLSIEADRDDLSGAQQRSRRRQAEANRALAARAAGRR